ncbi:SUMF1/EgtB/PvdO family nonheme iron enzyme [Spirulina sp. 06S082]|uniref:SUMF1/EgtB/PvdO family nonheme iron enzyme n=1 Tax=Spirulina sp. 06S082 TaxID=3110248 RepID=UPI002B1EDA7B|nr:SUMF1/EgtB/PvdO family nonheme iron enzyme [Spirulina sp. 06S082]MEA5469274.1 SUMF1/EgtB/PvdO family nonheme iron enzyme [Spirulina sp. 06S082]
MKLTSLPSKRETIRQNMIHVRDRTLELFTDCTREEFCQQAHPDFSPVGWHLGHIALTESLWILEHCAGEAPLFPEYRQLLTADGLRKEERQNLPSFSVIQDYLETVRNRVFKYLEIAPIAQQERLLYWLLQHENQHNETIVFLLQLLRWKKLQEFSPLQRRDRPSSPSSFNTNISDAMVTISAGEFLMGNNNIEAQDNERPEHLVYLDTYQIDRFPVTCQQYQEFMAAGGYQKAEFWSKMGWQWLQKNPVVQPLYWRDSPDWKEHPVCGVSYYEAEAYATFTGKRLPTEAEWEKAASWDAKIGEKLLYPWGNNAPNSQYCNYNTFIGHTTPVNLYINGQSPWGCWDMMGNVWEWTSSLFSGYNGFEFYPYRGYSQVYVDNKHRVLRGGSWATHPWSFRASFRNWYHPWVRQILVGFRCAM